MQSKGSMVVQVHPPATRQGWRNGRRDSLSRSCANASNELETIPTALISSCYTSLLFGLPGLKSEVRILPPHPKFILRGNSAVRVLSLRFITKLKRRCVGKDTIPRGANNSGRELRVPHFYYGYER